MGGIAIAAIGFEVTEVIDNSLEKHGSYKQLLRDLESKISTAPLSLARLEDSDGTIRMLLCFYIAYYQNKVYDCEELMRIEVPAEFSRRVQELLGFEAGLRRVFAPHAFVFSYDCNGRTRVIENGTVIGPSSSTRSVMSIFCTLTPSIVSSSIT